MNFLATTEDEIAKKEQEFQEKKLIPEGIYRFRVIDAFESVSNSGNEMITIINDIYIDENRKVSRKDFLLEKMPKKLKHFCDIAGLQEKYEKGTLSAEDCIGKEGWLEIVIDPPKPKPEGGMYSAKNSVNDYCPPPPGARMPVQKAMKSNSQFSDDIPF